MEKNKLAKRMRVFIYFMMLSGTILMLGAVAGIVFLILKLIS